MREWYEAVRRTTMRRPRPKDSFRMELPPRGSNGAHAPGSSSSRSYAVFESPDHSSSPFLAAHPHSIASSVTQTTFEPKWGNADSLAKPARETSHIAQEQARIDSARKQLDRESGRRAKIFSTLRAATESRFVMLTTNGSNSGANGSPWSKSSSEQGGVSRATET